MQRNGIQLTTALRQGPQVHHQRPAVDVLFHSAAQLSGMHPLWDGVADDSWFYFVHSYYVRPADAALTVGTSKYGSRFTCAVARDNIFATQFHPEKSAAAGLRIYQNFCRWAP